MGLLDDAIREHLELKRRHGADPDEVARQEREALGAPRRGEFAQPEGAAAETAVDVAPEAAPDFAPEPPVDIDEAALDDAGPEEQPERPAAEAPPEPAAPPLDVPTEEHPPPEPPAGTEEDPWLVEDLADEVPADETLEHPPGEPAEDVLEETPEFLQETPEHERLWFEQKPPRGFDWDK
jgi:hypothetical protein